ncbi:MAG TPA: c-type cytochrome domain-containing protein [Anaerolineales bacterium]|nr:c-type cytochrome domain-containing protein [Anaerolineales bacterium]
MKKQFGLLIIAALLVSASAILRIGSTEAAPAVNISYANDVQPILQSRCGKCHMGEFVSEGLHMDTYESLMEGSDNGPVIVPGDADESLLVHKVVEGKMPKRGPRLTMVQIQIISSWIDAGAPNN